MSFAKAFSPLSIDNYCSANPLSKGDQIVQQEVEYAGYADGNDLGQDFIEQTDINQIVESSQVNSKIQQADQEKTEVFAPKAFLRRFAFKGPDKVPVKIVADSDQKRQSGCCQVVCPQVNRQ